jgi:hypothetical protein
MDKCGWSGFAVPVLVIETHLTKVIHTLFTEKGCRLILAICAEPFLCGRCLFRIAIGCDIGQFRYGIGQNAAQRLFGSRV